jgi:hypothetical protein
MFDKMPGWNSSVGNSINTRIRNIGGVLQGGRGLTKSV